MRLMGADNDFLHIDTRARAAYEQRIAYRPAGDIPEPTHRPASVI